MSHPDKLSVHVVFETLRLGAAVRHDGAVFLRKCLVRITLDCSGLVRFGTEEDDDDYARTRKIEVEKMGQSTFCGLPGWTFPPGTPEMD